jgi:hypothetical protein
MATPTTKETVNKRITNRLQITGGAETFIMSEACNKKVPAQELSKCTFMGKTYYGLSGKLEKAPAFLHILPQTLIDIEHCFALDDGQVTVETCQQKELFQHFSKLEKVAGRAPPERNMQELLDCAGLTWADVPAHLIAQGVGGARAALATPGASGSAGVGSEGVRVSGVPSSGGVTPGGPRGEEGEGDLTDNEEKEEENEESDEAETGDETGGGRLGNAFEDADLQESARGRGGRGGRRGRCRGRSGTGRQKQAPPGRRLPPPPGRRLLSARRAASIGGYDARTAKAQGIAQASLP